MAGIKFFLFVIALQCPPSLLLPQIRGASDNTKPVVLETNQTEALNNSELIQQIDLKDNGKKYMSNINDSNVDTNDDSNNTGAKNALKAENITKNAATVDDKDDKLTPEDEAPAFRSLIPDKVKQQLSKTVSTTVEPKAILDNNLVLKLSPDSPQITVDLYKIPLSSLFGEALSLINRFRRDTNDADATLEKANNKSVPNDEQCNKTKTNNDLNPKSLAPTRKSLQEELSDVKEIYETVELVCPLSVLVELYKKQVLSKLVKGDLYDILNRILSDFMVGEDLITIISKEISELPLKLKVKLQLLRGKTQEFIEQLQKNVNGTCSIS